MNFIKGLLIWALALKRSILQFVAIYQIINQQGANKIPIIEFIDKVFYPVKMPYKCKKVGLVEIYDDNMTIQDIENISYLYETISLSLGNMKKFYDNQYKFNHESIASVNSFMIDFDDSIDKCTLNDVSKYANYFIN